MKASASVGPAAADRETKLRVAVVIPCYRVKAQIAAVISAIGPEVERIYVVDDACPESSGEHVLTNVRDSRVHVLRNDVNAGVGGAMIAGYRAALDDGADIVVKLDGDGQMDPELIPDFIAPICALEADYTKGNRFFNPEDLTGMPWARLLGNAVLSFACKLSSGYWSVFDPTNGFTAIHGEVLRMLPLEKIANRYFFESDMLFRLNTIRARVVDIPMRARYAGERSSMRLHRVALEFPALHLRNLARRIAYNYFLRDFSIASLELLAGLLLFTFGACFGTIAWIRHATAGVYASTGTVMVAVLPLLSGLQLLLSFANFDINSAPDIALCRLRSRRTSRNRE